MNEKKVKILIVLVGLFLNSSSFSKELVRVPFIIIENKIILKIEAVNHQRLNIIFDSGSADFELDSSFARKMGLINDSPKLYPLAFMNGIVKAAVAPDFKLFTDSALNQLYKRANCPNLNEWSKKYGVHIDGLIGVNYYFKKLVVDIDFEKNLFTISDNSNLDLTPDRRTLVLKMTYTDAGQESLYSKTFHQASACKIKVYLPNQAAFQTNVLFDTGFNKSFLMLTTLNVDSIIKLSLLPFTVSTKKTSLGADYSDIYEIRADSILLDEKRRIYAPTVQVSTSSKVAIAGFGSTNTYCLAGVEFLKQHKQVIFDYLGMKLILVK